MFARLSVRKIVGATARRFLGTDEKLVKTAFYDLHLSHGGKMVPFAGYELPVQVGYMQ